MRWWPFRRKQVDTREVTWVEFVDEYKDDPSDERHSERMLWLWDQVGKGNFKYCYEECDYTSGIARIYGFYDKNQAMMFKLTWGGA